MLQRKKATEDWLIDPSILDKYIRARSVNVFRRFQREKRNSLVNENLTSKYKFGINGFEA